MNEADELKLYRGLDYRISDGVVIRHPSLGEICDYGEQNYYQMVCHLTAVGADLKWQLYDAGIDYTKIDDFDLFCSVLRNDYGPDETGILFGASLNFPQMALLKNRENDEVILYQEPASPEETGITITRDTYLRMTDYMRKMHRIPRNDKLPANEATKKLLIEDDREDYLRNKDKPYRSLLQPLISAMVNIEGFKRNDETVWDMKINAFLDSVMRIGKIRNASLLLQSGYSGFGVDLKTISKKELDYMGRL